MGIKRNELEDLKRQLYHMLMSSIRKEVIYIRVGTEDRFVALEGKLDEVSTNINDVKTALSGAEQEKETIAANELQKLKSEKDKLQSDYESLEASLNEKLSNAESKNRKLEQYVSELKTQLRDKLAGAQKEKENLERNLAAEKANRYTLADEKNKLFQSLREKNTECERLDGENQGLKKDKAKLDDELYKLNIKLKDLQQEVDDLRKVGNEAEQQIKQLEKEAALSEEKITKLENEKAELESNKADLENEKTQLLSHNEDMSKAVTATRGECDELKKKINEFKSAAEPYEKIAKLAAKCPSMKYLAEDVMEIKSFEEMNMQDMVVFINRFAWDFTFARLVYNSMKKYKEENPVPITEDELLFIEAINTFYKERYGEKYAGFDALDCMSIHKNGKTPFDRKHMMILNDYRNTNIADAEVLYVPELKMQNGKDIEMKAIIAGH